MTRPPPTPPRPEHLRRPRGGFGWLDDRLLHDRWLADLGPEAVAVLVLLAVAADRRGASFYGRLRMAAALGLDVASVDRALQKLVDSGLLAFRPWRPGQRDGVWQLLDIPVRDDSRIQRCVTAADVLRRLGLAPPHGMRPEAAPPT